MHNKSFLFGFGTGMIILSLVFYVFLSIEHVNLTSDNKAEVNEVTKTAEPVVKTDETSSEKVQPPTEAEIIQLAEALGMSFMPDNSISDEMKVPIEQNIDESIIIADDNEEPPAEIPENTETGDTETDSTEDGIITVFIPPGSNAGDAARILHETGIIENYRSFYAYLVEKGYTRKIDAGNFNLKPNSNFDEIADILVRK